MKRLIYRNEFFLKKHEGKNCILFSFRVALTEASMERMLEREKIQRPNSAYLKRCRKPLNFAVSLFIGRKCVWRFFSLSFSRL